jgi:Glycosyl hydrolase family 20, domain 2/Glycosyl hydrolase family 20, catalytic domain
MNDLTRREFLSTVAGVAVGTTMAAHSSMLQAAIYPASAIDSVAAKSVDTPLPSLIFPAPQHISASDSSFLLDSEAFIAVPKNATEQDYFLARSLAHELSDRFDRHLRVEQVDSLDSARRTIVMGSAQNPLVQQSCTRMGIKGDQHTLGPEGYILQSDKNLILIAGGDDRGAFWGFQSLRQLVFQQDHQISIRGVQVRDWPDKQFRGIYLFLPGRENIQYFRRFIRDYMALYKYNTLIMEIGASMRLDRHPELNAGWVEFARDCNYSCRNYPPDPFHNLEQNSSHQDTGDGAFLEKEEVADLAGWVAKHHIELIPEVASFTHSYYLLTRHKALAAVPENKWPDIYCAANKDSYSLVCDVYDEFIDVLKPKMVHIGHDELFLPVNVSSTCRDEDIGELFGRDVKIIHDHLASRGVKTAIWGDMLLESVRGRGLKKHTAPDGFAYSTPGGMTPEQAQRLIPKDCLIFNWFWEEHPGGEGGNAKLNENTLEQMGFQQVYGNFEPTITDYESRKQRPTLLGGAPSAWFATNENGFGKELLATFLGCSGILWTGQVPEPKTLSDQVQSMIPTIRTRLSGVVPPSQTETSIIPVDISTQFNFGSDIPELKITLPGTNTGTVRSSTLPFDLKMVNNLHSILVGTDGMQPSGLPKHVTGILIGTAPTSLIFLHASAKPASNTESFRIIWDQQDTADLLGWYEIVYEDGYVTTIPIRYGVNILEWDWRQRTAAPDQKRATYCYGADAVSIGNSENPVTFFALEWINPRLGKIIREVRLSGTTGFRGGSTDFDNDWGHVIQNNAVMLKAVTLVQKRS